jgi:serralysin
MGDFIMPSIASIVAGDSRFNILLSALQYVDSQVPGSNLVTTLSSSATDVTVFAPTDAAFGQLAVDLGYTGDTANEANVTSFIVSALPATTIRDVLLYHVSPEARTLAEVAALDEVPTLNGATFAPDDVTLIDREPDLINPSLIQTDVMATNGIVHVIDRVLLPLDIAGNDALTITGIVAASGNYDANGADFDILLNAVLTAGLEDVLADADADLTVFAPDDAAFLGLAATLGYTGTSESSAFDYLVESLTLLSGGADPVPLLTEILLTHVVPESLQASQVLASSELGSLQGLGLGVSGATLVDADPDLANPAIVATDIQAANGVVHVINGVLLPADILQSNGTDSVDFVISGNRNDKIWVGRDNDLVDGNGGNDFVFAGSGNDIVLGGTGRDRVFGSFGNDTINGDAGNDQLFGDNGIDMINGGSGNDRLEGGRGADIFVFAEGNDRDLIIDFKNGTDKVDVSEFDFDNIAELRDGATFSRQGTWTIVDFDNGDRIEIQGVPISHLGANDFIFV